MRSILFAKRNTKEILRDPINLFFGLGFPLILLALLSFINKRLPHDANNSMFEITRLASGISAFAPVFMSLFSGMLLSKDRSSSFLMRLFASPMTAVDFILGYSLPMLVFTVAQAAITFLAACIIGLEFSANILLAIAVNIPVAVLFVGIGLLCGCLLNEKAVGGICGALLTNVSGWLSGTWIPLDLIGGTFKKIAEALPFYRAVQATYAALTGDFSAILNHLAVVFGYMIVLYALAVIIFNHKMSSDNV
ncbi:MAG: ABC-2 type transporter [Firmicutes bacterium ADurb.Bin182]|nr:MAG: ABC-2 type transporter [Firmicutes bacterium ADurb.Bin182]